MRETEALDKLRDLSRDQPDFSAPDVADVPDTLFTATVHDVFSHTGAYQIATPYGDLREAVLLSHSGTSPLGAREINQLQIGDPVVCYFPQQHSYGYIISAAPSQHFDPRFNLPDSLVLRSRVGFFEDQMHYTPYENEENRLINASCGRPVDSLQGDWGYINELGAAIWLGKLLVGLRASDIAKVEAFYGDNLLRVFGYNLHMLTAARERFSCDDEGEYDEIEHWTPFMWESLGLYKPGKEVFEEKEGDDGGLKQGQEKTRFEPKEEKQTMAFRGLNLRGYIGEGSRQLTALLPPDGEEIAKRDDELKFRGVLEVTKSLDGTYAVRSAKEIILEKSLMVPVPRQLKDPDDPEGDKASGSDANYKSAGYYGSGPDHEKKTFKWPEDKDYADVRNTLLWEYEEYLFNKFALQVLDSHEEDWETPEMADVKIDDSKDNEIDSELYESSLEFDAARKLPKYGEVQIDQRSDYKTRYYQSRSCFHMMDDGSIIIEDGYGSQIIMSGGHIHLTCQGDVFARPGRNFITWAPRDFIARAGWCAEVSAAKKDLRLKAENNVHMLAHGDKSSVLIECRATNRPSKSDWTEKYGEDIESGGIIMKAEESAIDVWSKRVFAGSRKGDDGRVELSSGIGKTTVGGGEVGVEATDLYGVLVGGARRSTGCAAQFNMNMSGAQLISKLDIVGNLGVWQGCKGSGRIEADENILTKGAVIADRGMSTESVMAAGTMVAQNEHNSRGKGVPSGVSSRGGATQAQAEAAKEPLYAEFEDVTLDDTDIGAGNQAMWQEIGFSFRKSLEHYKIATDFRLPESRWQQMYRVFGTKKQWDEPVVEAPDGTETRPHPGQKSWDEDSHYTYTEPGSAKNVDYRKGQAKKREEQSEEPPSLTDVKLSSEYVITVQET